MSALSIDFYHRDTVEVARDLLGKRLVSAVDGETTAGRIVEVEAYLAHGDPACHAARGQTRRNRSMFGPPGRAYVYSIHARWCFNAVTEPEGCPSAVLIRAVEPLQGLPLMSQRRGTEKLRDLCRGPARLCEALAIGRNLDGWNLTAGRWLWIEDDVSPEEDCVGEIVASPRIGISSARELPLRFFLADSPFVSRPRMSVKEG